MSTFTKQAAQATRTIRAEAKRTAARALLVRHPAVREAFESFPASMRTGLSMSIAAYSSTVYISASMRGLASFKDKQLTRLLERFMGDEWVAQVTECTGSSTPNKDFSFSKKIDGMEIHVSIYAYVKSDSPLCRIVVTGVTERVVREEVKQIVCA